MSVLRQKLVAFSIHLGLSLAVVGSFLLFLFLVVYTPPILRLEGGSAIALMVLAVDVSLGPLLTLILYRKGKWGLKFDMGMILTLQLAAFLYGAWTLYSQRPLYLAFTVEHFRIVPAADIDIGRLTVKELAPGLLSGPRLVYVVRPEGDERQRIMFDALAGGKDIQYYPEYYRPLEDHLDEVRKRSVRLERLAKERKPAAIAVEERLTALGLAKEQVLILPIVGHHKDGALLLDPATGAILGEVDAVVW